MVAFSTNSRWAAPLRSVLIGFGFFFLGSLSDLWLQQHAASRAIAILDDALVGIGVGLLVLLHERRQRRDMIRKLEVIRLMNHHVRNSLQVIAFANSLPQQEELANTVRAAVERIEWALREVLPGQREDISNLSFHPDSYELFRNRKLRPNSQRSMPHRLKAKTDRTPHPAHESLQPRIRAVRRPRVSRISYASC